MSLVKKVLFGAVLSAVAAGGFLLPSATTADAYRPCGTCPPDWFTATHP